MAVFEANPLTDPRWPRFLQRHAQASIFHSPQWLDVLRRSYGYQPVLFTTAQPGSELEDGMVFCHVRSWLTGNRLVSLPFSDHCEPLGSLAQIAEILAYVTTSARSNGLRCVEIRPLRPPPDPVAGAAQSESFALHRVDLTAPTEQLFGALHKDSVRRKIRRAEREGLEYRSGTSAPLLQDFYRLVLLTRRRQQIPPQPLYWYQNVLACLGERAMVRMAYTGERPVAGMLTLTYKESVVYKYGCSDHRFNNLGGTPFLFWKCMREAQRQELKWLDLGRTEESNEGLLTFKDRLGAQRSPLVYWRLPENGSRPRSPGRTLRTLSAAVLKRIPDSFTEMASRHLYRHFG